MICGASWGRGRSSGELRCGDPKALLVKMRDYTHAIVDKWINRNLPGTRPCAATLEIRRAGWRNRALFQWSTVTPAPSFGDLIQFGPADVQPGHLGLGGVEFHNEAGRFLCAADVETGIVQSL